MIPPRLVAWTDLCTIACRDHRSYGHEYSLGMCSSVFFCNGAAWLFFDTDTFVHTPISGARKHVFVFADNDCRYFCFPHHWPLRSCRAQSSVAWNPLNLGELPFLVDRKSTRLNSSH